MIPVRNRLFALSPSYARGQNAGKFHVREGFLRARAKLKFSVPPLGFMLTVQNIFEEKTDDLTGSHSYKHRFSLFGSGSTYFDTPRVLTNCN